MNEHKKNNRINLRVSEKNNEKIKEIQKIIGTTSVHQVLEYLIDFYEQNIEVKNQLNDLQHQIDLIKKYENETRRNEYITHDLLSAICINLGITVVGRHDKETYTSKAYLAAKENVGKYLNDINMKKKNGSFKVPSDDEMEME